jgi:predicted transcriptional regulator YdeE
VPRLVVYEGATVLGITIVTSNAAEANPADGKIAGLWTRFYQEDVLSTIPGKKTPVVPLGVYTNYESDHSGQYQLMAGAAVDPATATPEEVCFGRRYRRVLTCSSKLRATCRGL